MDTTGLPLKGGNSFTVRISRIAGHFLVFDAADVMFLRRKQNVVSVLVGTTPQAPSQNAFLGLPLELGPEEACSLVDRGVAYIVDDSVAHLRGLQNTDPTLRKAYIDLLRNHQSIVQKIHEERKQSKKLAGQRWKLEGKSSSETRDDMTLEDPLTFGDKVPEPVSQQNPSRIARQVPASRRAVVAVTPTADKGLATLPSSDYLISDPPQPSPLYNHLQASGYTMTPGIRFGVTYSVYPGDPMRFHAHFLAEEYGWDEETRLLDLAGLGRLATGVKKGLLIGAQEGGGDGVGNDGSGNGKRMKTFCLEWAGM